MLNQTVLAQVCRTALAEDVGSGDATTLAVVPEGLDVEAVLVTRKACVCAGLPVARAVFAELDAHASFVPQVDEGACCTAGTVLAVLQGRAQAVLTGERTALNFLQRLCGIATLTRRYVEAVGPHKARILDTRKTTPGLRLLEKYAVKTGGGENHRFGLFDRILLKDNHLALAACAGPEPISRAIRACRGRYPDLDLEVEADSLEQVEQAVAAGADIILLDNMSNDEMAAAVKLVHGRALLEASGRMTLERVAAVAALGVDFISVGALTHSAPATDIGLDIAVPRTFR